jgi:NitT/TauT family transport system substrate-binding protein
MTHKVKHAEKSSLHMRALCVVCLLFLVVACSPEATPTAAVIPTPEPVSLKVGTLPFLSNAIIKIAAEEGFFAQQGLAVELVEIKQSSEMIPLLVKGDLDAGTPALRAALFNAVAAGGRVKIVLPLTEFRERECEAIAFLARKEDVDSGKYQDPANWKGLHFTATEGVQGVLGYVASRALGPAGLTLDDIEAEKIEAPAQEEALRSGQVDIAYAVEPWVTRAQAAGDISLLLPAERFAPGLPSSAIVFGARLLDNPEIGQRFAIAYLQAVRQYLEGKTPRNVEIVSAFTGLDAELVAKVCWTYSPPDGSINGESLMDYQQWLKEQGQVDQILPVEDVVDTRFASEAVRVLDGTGQ